MTWGEIQIESLKKMFLNNDDLKVEKLNEYKDDKKYKTYLFAMPQACNEAIEYICNLEPLVKSYELVVEKEKYDLSELIDDFKGVENVISNSKWEMESQNVLKVDRNSGKITIYYEAYPELVSSTTLANKKIEISRECVRYIPLYIAGQLYKDDDLTLATMYMNEFVNNINLITGRIKNVVNNKIIPIYQMY